MKLRGKRFCSFHHSGVPPEWKGPFFVAKCERCAQKLRDGLTTADAPNPDSQRRPIMYARVPVSAETRMRWMAQLAGIKTGDEG